MFSVSLRGHQLRFEIRDRDARDSGSANVPWWRVRKQTRDVVVLMQLARSVGSDYYMLMEDDFAMCSRTLQMLPYYVDKATRLFGNGGWLSLKVSYGLNGFMLRNGADLDLFASYLLEHAPRRPPDHLQTEWSCGETDQSKAQKASRPHLVSRFNLFAHLGTHSSLRAEKSPDYPPCYHELTLKSFFRSKHSIKINVHMTICGRVKRQSSRFNRRIQHCLRMQTRTRRPYCRHTTFRRQTSTRHRTSESTRTRLKWKLRCSMLVSTFSAHPCLRQMRATVGIAL